jgi:predicted porin
MMKELQREAASASTRRRGQVAHRRRQGVYRYLTIVAGGVLLSTVSVPAAVAADLGGNCCADLEERVAELEATTVRKGNRRVSLTLSGQVSRSVMYWNDGFAHDVYSVDNSLTSSRFRLLGTAKINADLSAGFQYEMDMRIGSRSNQVTQIDDDGVSGTGGILGNAALGDGIGGAGDSVLGIRTANWWIESKHWGRLRVGRLESATHLISTIDLSTTGVVVDSEPGEYQAAFLLRNGRGALGSSWSNTCGGPQTLSTDPAVRSPGAGPYGTDCFEHGPSRRDGVRYDTPTLHGFTFSTAWGEDDFWDAALRYAGEWHGFRLAAGAGYRIFRDREPDFLVLGPPDRQLADTDRRQWLTSASLMHVASGLYLNLAYTRYQWRGDAVNERFFGTDDNRPDIPLWYVAAGIQRNWHSWGATNFYAEYGKFFDGTTGLLAKTAYAGLGPGVNGAFGDNVVVLDSDVTWWGLGAVQTIDAAAMDLYIAFRRYSTGATISGGFENQVPGGFEDIWFIQAGARIQF